MIRKFAAWQFTIAAGTAALLCAVSTGTALAGAPRADKAAALTAPAKKLAGGPSATKISALAGHGGASRAIAAPAPKLAGTAALLKTPLPGTPAAHTKPGFEGSAKLVAAPRLDLHKLFPRSAKGGGGASALAAPAAAKPSAKALAK